MFIKAQDIRKSIQETEDKLQQLRNEYRLAQNKKPFESQIVRLEQILLKLYGQSLKELEAKSRAEEISYLIKMQNQKKIIVEADYGNGYTLLLPY